MLNDIQILIYASQMIMLHYPVSQEIRQQLHIFFDQKIVANSSNAELLSLVIEPMRFTSSAGTTHQENTWSTASKNAFTGLRGFVKSLSVDLNFSVRTDTSNQTVANTVPQEVEFVVAKLRGAYCNVNAGDADELFIWDKEHEGKKNLYKLYSKKIFLPVNSEPVRVKLFKEL